MEILYKVHNNLYVNLTNRCPYACTFCLRQTMDRIGESDRLWLEREPLVDEVKKEFDKFDMSQFDEVVFCGFGEPTERFDDLKEVAAFVKKKFAKKIRINTNGAGSLINGRDIAPEMEGLIDTVSISLNNPVREEYLRLVRSKFGEKSFDAMLDFARECTKYVPNVVMTTVDTTITKEEEAQCKKICDEIGAAYRIRPWEE
ncbi:MAG: TIGR04100 family radical SAM protein [Eubacteriales bacterium]|nr:TIGR04100 family radical SAM protein [Eubacteriales bacterium]